MTTRIKRIGGQHKTEGFLKLLQQLNGRAVLVVTIINQHCDECIKLHNFIGQLEQGFIDKFPQLVMVYGISDKKIATEGSASKPRESNNNPDGAKKARLSDTRILEWDGLPEGHGYAIFLSDQDILYYKGEFNHDEFITNIVDNIRRFRSSIKTLAGLKGKRVFLEKKRSGIIIETSGTTQNSQILELENKVKTFERKVAMPFYFCKSMTQEMSYVVNGEVKLKAKGLNLEKFLRKIQRT